MPGSDAFSGETKSVGAGLYASAMFESGAYIDLIGKYVHHDNEYTATFAGLGTRDYSSHSWYAGAEVGYRYHVTDSAWIEPPGGTCLRCCIRETVLLEGPGNEPHHEG